MVTRVLLVTILMCLLFGTVESADWHHWRGPNANGISEENSWNPQALKKGPNIAWETNVGKGHSTVAIKDNFLYTTGTKNVIRGSETSFEDIIFCLNSKTGKEIWRYSYAVRNTRFPGPRATPVLDETNLYNLSWEGHLFCLNAKTGAVIWMKNIVAENLAKIPEWGFCGSPIVEGDLLIITGGKSGLAFNKKTGAIVWKSEFSDCGHATPVLFDYAGKRLAAIYSNNDLHAVDIKTGKIQWTHPWSSYADPVISGKSMLLTAGRNAGQRGYTLLDISKNDPEVLWHTSKVDWAFQSNVIIDGYTYGLQQNRGDKLQCIDIKSGEIKWTEKMGDWGSLMASNGKLIILKGDGELIIAEASPVSYKIISSARVLQMDHWQNYPQNEPKCCWTTPVLANGRIYARNTYGDLVCVDMTR